MESGQSNGQAQISSTLPKSLSSPKQTNQNDLPSSDPGFISVHQRNKNLVDKANAAIKPRKERPASEKMGFLHLHRQQSLNISRGMVGDNTERVLCTLHFAFQAGFTNAVRRKVPMQDFLE